jgi:hypothetical protein
MSIKDTLRQRIGSVGLCSSDRIIFRDFIEGFVATDESVSVSGDITVDSVVTGDFTLSNTSFEDLRFPLTGRNIDTASGRIDYNFYNGSVVFADNARYNIAETVSFLIQLPHSWKEGTDLRPHIHWLQQSSNMPNWLIAYKWYAKAASTVISTDWTGHTFSKYGDNAFTYSTGVIHQLTGFSNIDATGKGFSDCLHICLWRDSGNDSGEFTGADPSSLDEHVLEFDIHYEVDSFGTDEEFSQE